MLKTCNIDKQGHHRLLYILKKHLFQERLSLDFAKKNKLDFAIYPAPQVLYIFPTAGILWHNNHIIIVAKLG